MFGGDLASFTQNTQRGFVGGGVVTSPSLILTPGNDQATSPRAALMISADEAD